MLHPGDVRIGMSVQKNNAQSQSDNTFIARQQTQGEHPMRVETLVCRVPQREFNGTDDGMPLSPTIA